VEVARWRSGGWWLRGAREDPEKIRKQKKVSKKNKGKENKRKIKR
jgi:hypothetical protein